MSRRSKRKANGVKHGEENQHVNLDGFGVNYKKDLTSILTSLVFFPIVIITLIGEYSMRSWQGIVARHWKLPKITNDPRPFGIAYFQKHLYVSDPVNQRLYLYSLTGDLIETWTSIPSTSNIITYPRGLDTFEDHLYVVHGSDLCVLDNKNKLVHNWNLPGDGLCLKVDKERIFITLDGSKHQVYVYNRKGQHIDTYGKEGVGHGEFETPSGVTCDDVSLYVCDCWNHRIQVLNKMTGTFIRLWIAYDKQNDGGLFFPHGILLEDDLIYVSDKYRVQMFNKEGLFIQRLGKGAKEGKEEGELNFPTNMCIMENSLYVTDFFNGRVQVFL